jgi:hypothetical protein
MRLRSTRGLRVGGPVPWVAGAVVLVLGCHSQFTGPYPCKPGYASCLDPSQNRCETNTATDGLSCGACGVTCGIGAPCVASRCGKVAVELATLNADSPTLLQTNSSAVFWFASNNVLMLPVPAGAGTASTTVAKGIIACGNPGQAFGVDDANVYYWSDGSDCGVGTDCAGLTQRALADGARTVLVPAAASAPSNLCGSLAVGATSVYLLVNQQKGNMASYTVYGAQKGVAGQTLQTVATAQSYNSPLTSALAVNSTALFFELSNANNALSFALVPLAGGPMRTLSLDLNTYGYAVPFAVDETDLYAVAAGCACNNNQNNGNQTSGGVLPAGNVVKIPLGGGPSTVLAAFSGQVGGIGVDATAVYWSTDTSVWKVPRAGGAASPIAGNLMNSTAPFKCVTCGGGQPSSTAIAVGASSLFVAVTSPNENAVLEVAK